MESLSINVTKLICEIRKLAQIDGWTISHCT